MRLIRIKCIMRLSVYQMLNFQLLTAGTLTAECKFMHIFCVSVSCMYNLHLLWSAMLSKGCWYYLNLFDTCAIIFHRVGGETAHSAVAQHLASDHGNGWWENCTTQWVIFKTKVDVPTCSNLSLHSTNLNEWLYNLACFFPSLQGKSD